MKTPKISTLVMLTTGLITAYGVSRQIITPYDVIGAVCKMSLAISGAIVVFSNIRPKQNNNYIYIGITIGLLFCAVGDYFMSFNRETFVIGLFVFIIAYIALAITVLKSTLQIEPFKIMAFIVSLLISCIISGSQFLIWHLPPEISMQITIYSIGQTFVLTCGLYSLSQYITTGFQKSIPALPSLGLILMYGSDIIIGLNLFYTKINNSEIYIQATYITALIIFGSYYGIDYLSNKRTLNK